jgi:hypothetical protein
MMPENGKQTNKKNMGPMAFYLEAISRLQTQEVESRA